MSTLDNERSRTFSKTIRENIDSLIELSTKIKDEIIDKEQTGILSKLSGNKRMIFAVKSIVELVLIYLIMMALTNGNSKYITKILYLIFAKQVYYYVEEFYLDS